MVVFPVERKCDLNQARPAGFQFPGSQAFRKGHLALETCSGLPCLNSFNQCWLVPLFMDTAGVPLAVAFLICRTTSEFSVIRVTCVSEDIGIIGRGNKGETNACRRSSGFN